MNYFRKGDTGKRGDEGIKEFLRLAHEKGYECVESSRHEDMHLHFDQTLIKNGKRCKVEIKGIKRIKQNNEKSELTNLMWVEFLNVNGDPGWLYGTADFIAQQFRKGFFIIKRKTLKKIAERIASKAKILPYKKVNNLYRRRNRNDMVILIRLSDIEKYGKWWLS